MDSRASIDIDVREDGVYLVLNRGKGQNGDFNFAEAKLIIDQYGVQDWNYDIVNRALQAKEDRITLKISDETQLKAVNEFAKVSISRDLMTASITLYEARNGGKQLELDDLKAALEKANVVKGIDEEQIEELLEFKEYGIPKIVANGKAVENGKNGKIIYNFNTGKKSHKPKELEDGTVDYNDISLFDVATKGMVLATLLLPTEGVEGYNVIGDVAHPLRGKAVKLAKGKNTVLDEDGLNLISDIDGQIIFMNGKVNVEPVLELKQNVDNTTGNINFLGSVIVKGNVVSGFSVYATGNVDISGVIESASVHSDADIFVQRGIQGSGKARITAGGNLQTKYIENCSIMVQGDLQADAIMHSKVNCSGTLSLSGKKGLMVGGKIRVLQFLEAHTIGSHMATATDIHVGIDPATYERYRLMRDEYQEKITELSKVDLALDSLIKLKEAGQLSSDKRAMLVKVLQNKKFLKSKLAEMREKLDRIKPTLVKGNGTIKVKKQIHPGVKLTVGNATMFVRDTIHNCTVYNKDGEIKIGPY